MNGRGDGSGDPWYADGLRFRCTGCGLCCQGEGYVWVERREIRAIATFLGLTLQELGRRFLRRVGRRTSLTEARDGSCVFYSEGCGIYPVRPAQCRTFPFWKRNLESRQTWSRTAASCEGIGQGRHYPRHQIVRLRRGLGEASDATETDREEGKP